MNNLFFNIQALISFFSSITFLIISATISGEKIHEIVGTKCKKCRVQFYKKIKIKYD